MNTISVKKKMLVADLLCGAGGSSEGARRALLELGLDMELVCLNHWPTAIDTHQRNFPKARHYVQDIATVRPHLIVPEGYLDLLMASPTCTHHSVARGGKPTSDQQRSDPWHIITWLTELRVKRIIIENVWEFRNWGPVDHRTGKPIKSRQGEYFNAWIDTIRRLGFEPEWRKLNAADYGDATTRQRFILMARSDKRRVSWPMPTHMRRDQISGDLFDGGKPWRPAREIIDWSIRGRSIFSRKKPLATKTLARIYAGAVKFGWPEPFIVVLRNHMAAQGMHQPLPTIAANGMHIGIAEPVIVNMKGRSTASSAAEPLPTQTAQAPHLFAAEPVQNVVIPARDWGDAGTKIAEDILRQLAEPFTMSTGSNGAARSTGDPIATVTTGGAGSEDPGCARPMLVEPLVVSTAHGVDEGERDPHTRRVKSVDDPLGAIHAGGGNFGVVEPFVVSPRHSKEGAGPRPRAVSDPLPTLNASGSQVAVVEPFVLSQASGGAPRATSNPLPTIVTGGQRGSGTALISPYYGSGSGETCVSSEEPLPTVTAKGRFGMVVPVTNSNGGAQPRDIDVDPIATMTTAKGGEFAIVMPVTHHDTSARARDADVEPLPAVTGANRGELAFITAQHGERQGQAPRVHDVEDPAPTIAATGHVDLIEGTEQYDILFRMLEPHELAAAMGFNTDEAEYEFAGTKTEKIKQIGNAVSVSKMKACVGALMADAAPKRRAPIDQQFKEAAE